MTSQSPHINRWRAFALLAVAFFMTVIDLTIVNVSLPTIGRDLHFSQTNLQWVVTAYALTYGGFLLLGGRAADLLGRRRVLMLGLGLFSAASLAAALATGAGFLIGARAVQGLGAAIMLPAALSTVMNMFQRGRRAQQGARDLGRPRRRRRDRRRDRRRPSDPLRRLAVHLLPQRPDRRGRAAARSADRAREPARRRRGAVRRAGAITGTAGLVLLVDAISQAPQYGWGATRTIARPRRGRRAARRFPPDRAPGHAIRCCRWRSSGCARSPDANVAGPAAGRQLLRVHLRRHSLHAAGAPLQRAAVRARLAGRVADLDRARRPLPGSS